jgi:23S rRNA (uracil1939-C5)-methyltransferase
MLPMLRVEATIGSLAPGGDGVAHIELAGERRALFVAHGAPGDVMRAEVDPSQRPARGRLLELLTPGPDRVAPACPWFAACGGCDWMHLSIDAQARAHLDHVRAALPAAWQDVAITAHPAPDPLAYRTRARVHVRRDHGQTTIGMHRPRTHEPVHVDACAVLAEPLERARRRLAGLFDGSHGRGDAQIALGLGGVPVLDLRWTGELAPRFFGLFERGVAARDWAGARVTIGDAARPAIVGDPTPWMAGADGAPLRLTPGGFAQASERANAMLARHVADLARERRVDRALELYAGTGNFSVLLARDVGQLVAVEASREACEAARANLAARGLAARVVEADAAAFAWGDPTRLVVMDPPRTGARAAAERLASSRVRHVVYVSCDAQTLGRDLKILADGYTVRSVATFEMFPQTSHVEIVVALERVASRAARTRHDPRAKPAKPALA